MSRLETTSTSIRFDRHERARAMIVVRVLLR